MSQLLGDLRGIIRTAQTIEKYWNETTLSQDIDRLRSDLIALSLKSDPEMRRHIEYAVKHLTSQNTREHFLSVLIPLERVYAKAVVDADFLAIEGDKTQANCLPTPSGIDRPRRFTWSGPKQLPQKRFDHSKSRCRHSLHQLRQ